MKYLAHTAAALDSPIISIYEVIDGVKNNPKQFEKQKYYSLWYLTPMFPKVGKSKAPHFAFKQGYGTGSTEDSSGESIEHSITKYIIYEQKYLQLKYNYDRKEDIKGCIKFKDIKVEFRFNNGDYISDIYAQIEKDTILGLSKNDWLAIEILKTHKVSKYKTAFYQSQKIPAIEIKYYDEIRFENNKELLQKQIKGWLTKTHLYFKWLHNPRYKEIYLRNNVVDTNINSRLIAEVTSRQHTIGIQSASEANITVKNSIDSDIANFQIKRKSLWKAILSFLWFKE